jgi:hypothetical protein
MPAGSQIDDGELNSLQDRAQLLLGPGTGSRGYGQVLQSADVFAGNIITLAHFTSLRDDILSIRVHQDGTVPSTPSIARGQPINFNILTSFDSLLTTADANRFNIASGQSTVSAAANQTTSATWSTQAQATLTVTFGNANQARYFFNSGGKIRFAGARSGGSATSQNNAWTNFLANVGTISFGANTGPFVNYYSLTNVYQTYSLNNLSTPYSANSLRLEVRSDVADNSSGTATQVQIRITLRDDYTDPGSPAPGDSVDGTLAFTIEELKASGSLYPSGSWNIVSPSYSLSSISTS